MSMNLLLIGVIGLNEQYPTITAIDTLVESRTVAMDEAVANNLFDNLKVKQSLSQSVRDLIKKEILEDVNRNLSVTIVDSEPYSFCVRNVGNVTIRYFKEFKI